LISDAGATAIVLYGSGDDAGPIVCDEIRDKGGRAAMDLGHLGDVTALQDVVKAIFLVSDLSGLLYDRSGDLPLRRRVPAGAAALGRVSRGRLLMVGAADASRADSH
jgi:hypothetical protein